jgi:DNA repair protein RecO (recombination protein O)
MSGTAHGGPEDRSRVLLEDAVILHRRAYRETSLLLDAFSADSGRLRLLAKGAKRGCTAQSHLLQPFVRLRLSWFGRGELPVVTAAEPGDDVIHLDGAGLFCGFYMNELLLHLLPPHDPHPEVFRLYLDALRRLGAGECRENILRCFEVGLLEELGYGLSLERDAAGGQAIDPSKTYAYVIDRGPVEADEAGTDSVHGSTLLGLRRKSLDSPDELQEAKRLMRRVIHHYLNGRPLKSRDLFKQFGTARTV